MPPTRPAAARAARAAASAACAAGLLAACGEGGPRDIAGPAPSAAVKFFNFGIGAPTVNFFANDSIVTVISSTACSPLPADTTAAGAACRAAGLPTTLGVASGGAGAGGFYTGVAPGQYTFSARLSDTTAANRNVTVASFATPIAANSRYSVYLSGVYNATSRQVDGFVLQDNLPATIAPDSTYVRFVNASPTAGPMRLLFRGATTGVVFAQVGAPVAYKAGGQFVAFPVSAAGSGIIVDLVVRAEGSNTDVVARPSITFGVGRVTTVTLRGDATVTSTTAANRPQLDVTGNR